MRVVVAGSGTGLPDPERGSPSLAVSVAGQKVVVDIGPGALRQLARVGFDYRSIDILLLTHWHVDHINDLAPLVFASKHEAAPRQHDLHIVAPRGFNDFYSRLMALYGQQILPKFYQIRVSEVYDSVMDFSSWRLISKPTRHMLTSVGYRVVEGERAFAYTGDTDLCDSVVELCRDVDVAFVECALPDEAHVEGHMTPSRVARLVREANPKRVLLLHVYPVLGAENAAAAISNMTGLQVEVANDLMVVEV